MSFILKKLLIFNILYFCAIFAGEAIIDGTMCSKKSLRFSATTFKGNGTLIGKDITINCENFEFSGTIEPEVACTIRVKNKFNYEMFKRSGSGTITIIISSSNAHAHTFNTLCEAVETALFQRAVMLKSDMLEILRDIHKLAIENAIDPNLIVNFISNKIEEAGLTLIEQQKEEHNDKQLDYKDKIVSDVPTDKYDNYKYALLATSIVLPILISKYYNNLVLGFFGSYVSVTLIQIFGLMPNFSFTESKAHEREKNIQPFFPSKKILVIKENIKSIFDESYESPTEVIRF